MTGLDEIAMLKPSHAVLLIEEQSVEEEQALEQAVQHETAEGQLERVDEGILVHEWRAEQLQRLGLSRLLAQSFAGRIDWHDLAALVGRGCSPELALDILY